MSASPAASIVRDFARRHNAQLILSSDQDFGGGLIIFRNGRRQFFMLNELGIANPLGAFAALRVRSCGASLLSHFGYRAVPGGLFQRHGISINEDEPIRSEPEMLAAALHYAESLGWPVVVKANLNLNRNECLTKLVRNAAEFKAFSAAVFAAKRNLLVQPFVPGNSYFCMMFDNQLRFVLRKSALGSSDHHNFTDVTADIEPSYVELCRNICDKFGLIIACIEIITDDITRFDPNHLILQVDASPNVAAFQGLDAQQRSLLDTLYFDMFEHISLGGDPDASLEQAVGDEWDQAMVGRTGLA